MGSGLSKHEDEIRPNMQAGGEASKETEDGPSPVEQSKCPMSRGNGSYSYDWGALFRKDFPHGPNGSRPISREEAQKNATTANKDSSSSSSSGCPVKHKEYNVYSQPLDPNNNMPKVANQLPSSGQTKPLPTHRVSSSILKGGAEEGSTWTYPSPQMFYNALARKGKLSEDNEEQDMMETVVALHNDMNEKSWKKVLQWEAVATGQEEDDMGKSTKLLKFQGRPSDLSPKAWLKHYILGHPLPFDRHDWVVLRPDGTTVRYVLDYYYNEPETEQPGEGSTNTLLVDVRPALDGVSHLWYRAAMMPLARYVSQSTCFEPMPLFPTPGLKSQVSESIQVWQNIQDSIQQSKLGNNGQRSTVKPISEEEARKLAIDFDATAKDCKKPRIALDKCKSDEDCARASVNFTICMGKSLCQLQHQTLVKALQRGDEDSIEAALERINDCVAMKSQDKAMAQEQHPSVFK